MSEYMEKHSVARLIGSPPGYVGYEEGGSLTEAIRRRPYAVLLLDEIEKAHSDVLNVFLQILDDGRATDGHGRTVNFTNTLIIMTSNLGSHVILEESFSKERNEKVMKIVHTHFPPEFINRIDDIVIFSYLEKPHLAQIINQLVTKLNQTLEEQGIQLKLEPEASELLCEMGYDQNYGARPLKRVFQRCIQDPIAFHILEKKYPFGTTIQVGIQNGKFVFSPIFQEKGVADNERRW